MRKLGLALLLFGSLGLAPAQAQNFTMPPPAGVEVQGCVYSTSPPTLSAGPAFVQCNINGQQTIVTTPLAAPTTQLSGSITTGGTFQQLAAANTGRLSFDFQNLNAADACYLFFGTTAAATAAGTGKAILVKANQEYLRSSGAIPSDAIQVTCTTTSDTFYATVQ